MQNGQGTPPSPKSMINDVWSTLSRGSGKYCMRSWACIYHIEGMFSPLVLHGIVG